MRFLGARFQWLQHGYPVVLWSVVAMFTLLACQQTVEVPGSTRQITSSQVTLVQTFDPAPDPMPRTYPLK